jgi:energy-converting hydrogenase A subunit M
VVAADAFVDLLQDVLAFLSGDALHEYFERCAPPVELVSDEDIGLGTVDKLLGQVLV